MRKTDRLIERIRTAVTNAVCETAIPDKEYTKPFYDYMKKGQREQGMYGCLHGMTYLMIPVFFYWICKEASVEDFKIFTRFCKNNEVLADKIRPTVALGNRRIDMYRSNADGSLRQVKMTDITEDEQSLKGIFRQIAFAPNDGAMVLLYDRFCSWVNKDMDVTKDAIKKLLPSNMIMSNPEVTDVEWMIHFTPTAENMKSIANDGFRNGISTDNSVMRKMAFSRDIAKDTRNGKLFFAYSAQDIIDNAFIDKYDMFKHREFENNFDMKVWTNAIHYAVMFKANGIKVSHRTDKDMQIVFNGDTARDFVMLMFNWDNDTNEKTWSVMSKDLSRKVYTNKSLTNVVKWVTENERQYSKKITNKK